MDTDFDRWNILKKQIDKNYYSQNSFPKKREVWLCYLGKNIGNEQNGGIDSFLRPLLVLKKFTNEIYWTIPLTTKQKSVDFYHNYIDPNNNPAAVILIQVRSLNIRRFRKKLYKLPQDEFEKIKSRLREYLL